MSIVVTKENLWQYYIKLSDYDAKCKFCENKFNYVSDTQFWNNHIKIKHKIIFDQEKATGRQEWPWIFFKYVYRPTFYDFRSECLLCGADFSPRFLFLIHHLHEHSNKEVENYENHSWFWKYVRRSDDFEVECSMCPEARNNLYLNLTLYYHVTEHKSELENAQQTNDIIFSLKCVLDSKVIEIKNNMWEYYNNIQHHVSCKFCKYDCPYLHSQSIANFRRHINHLHTKIFDWEKEHKEQIWPYAYFKYCYQYIDDKEILYSKCLICRDVFVFNDVLAETHFKNLHSEDIKHFSIYAKDDWILKYCHQSGDKMKCNICYRNTSVQMLLAPLNHTIEKHSDILQWNMTQKLWQNFINLRNFQARCRFCNFQSYYIDTTNFIKHVKEEHIGAYNYEEANGEEWPFKFFNYINSTTVQCCLCSVIHESTDKSNLIKHMCEKHISEQPDYFINYGWIWKYCTKVSDFEVQCLCQNKISLDVPLQYFNRHIEDRHPNRLTIKQRTYDIAGPSGSQPN